MRSQQVLYVQRQETSRVQPRFRMDAAVTKRTLRIPLTVKTTSSVSNENAIGAAT